MEAEKTLNAISPYFTMFPLDFPMSIIETYSSPGDMVLDPFCGRGTTNFAARLLGRKTYGIDCNPMAIAVSRAKMVASTVDEIVYEAEGIINSRKQATRIPSGDFWQEAFNPGVLNDITKIRDDLLLSCKSSARIALRAIMLGSLHGPVNKGKPSYFSNQCPRTYAPKPDYAVRFWRSRCLKAPAIDVVKLIKDRAERYYGTTCQKVAYTIIQGDCRTKTAYSRLDEQGRADLIITSPPYPGMVSYSTDQWLRNWFVGGPSKIDYRSNKGIRTLNVSDFIAELRSVWSRIAEYSNPGALLVCRFGVLPSYKGDKFFMISESFKDTPWKIKNIISAGIARKGKRVAETLMGKNVQAPNEEIDIYCVK